MLSKPRPYHPLRTRIRQALTRGCPQKALGLFGLTLGSSIPLLSVHAATLGFDQTRLVVDEPDRGSRTVRLPITASFQSLPPGWASSGSCVISGEIWATQVETDTTGAREGLDYDITKASFSMTTQPRYEGEELVIDAVSDEVLFEIYDDGDEEESTENIEYSIASYGVSCEGESSPSVQLSNGYGVLVINDPFDEKDEQSLPDHSPGVIPPRQKSLTTQLNALRSLSIHSATARDKSIAREVARARRNKGFNLDELQAQINGEQLSAGKLVGGAAGDAFENFGRWGGFITGSVDVGKDKTGSAPDIEFDSDMLIGGLSYHLSEHLLVGGAVAYTNMGSEAKTIANTDLHRTSASLFLSAYAAEAYYLDILWSSGNARYSLDRRVQATDTEPAAQVRANTDGQEMSGSLGAGYNFRVSGLDFRAFTFWNYVDIDIDGYSESAQDSAIAARVDGMDLQSFTGDLGLEVSSTFNTDIGVFLPSVSLAYEKQFADDSVTVSGNFIGSEESSDFFYAGPERDSNYLAAQLSLSAVLPNGISAFVSYDTFLQREGFDSSQLTLGARLEF